MNQRKLFFLYSSALVALIVFIGACTGQDSTPTPETTSVAMAPTEIPETETAPIPGQRRGDEEESEIDEIADKDGDGIPDHLDDCPDEGDIYGFGVDERGCPYVDSDSDGIPDHLDACPFDGDEGFGIDPSGCPNPPPDSDGDGIPDHLDSCPFDGDMGYGVDPSGCPYPPPPTEEPVQPTEEPVQPTDEPIPTEEPIPTDEPTEEPIPTDEPTEEPIIVDVVVQPTLNIQINAYCQYFYTQPTAVFAFTNPNASDIDIAYTDQDGVVTSLFVPSLQTIYHYITPNNDGFASVQLAGVDNFASVSNCFTAQLSIVSSCDTATGRVNFSLSNTGPGTVQSSIQWQLFGAETISGTFGTFGGPEGTFPPNQQIDMSGLPDAQGFLRFLVADYNFNYTNPEPCLPSIVVDITPDSPPIATEESMPDITPEPPQLEPKPLEQVGWYCGADDQAGTLFVVIKSFSDAEIRANTPIITEGLITQDGTLGVDMLNGDEHTIGILVDAQGFARLIIPDFGISFQNPEPCPLPELPDIVVEITPEATPTDESTPEVTPEPMSITATCEVRQGQDIAVFSTQNLPDDATYTFVGTSVTTEMRQGELVLVVVPDAQGFASIDFGVPGGYAEITCGAPAPRAEFGITFSQSCDPTTGINTLSFTSTNVETLTALLDANPSVDRFAFSNYRLLAGQDGTLLTSLPIGISPLVYELNTNGRTAIVLTYPNPESINALPADFGLSLVTIQLCGRPTIGAGDVAAVQTQLICDDTAQELVVMQNFFNLQYLAESLAQANVNVPALGLFSVRFVNYAVTIDQNPFNTYLQGSHDITTGGLVLRIPYSALLSMNLGLTYDDYQPFVDYLVDVAVAVSLGGAVGDVALPSAPTIAQVLPLPPSLCDLSVVPELTATPEPAPQAVVPPPPSFSVDDVTCASFGTLSAQITQGDVTAYGQQIDALLRQLVPQGNLPFTFWDIYNTLGGANGVQIILSHTSPVNMAQIETMPNWIGGSPNGVILTNGTRTFTISLSVVNMPDSTVPFYLTFLSAEKLGMHLNALLQPLVDRYNNGETITLADLASINPTSNQAALMTIATHAQQLESQLVAECLYASRANFQMSVTQTCDDTTRINTISFDISGADDIIAGLQGGDFASLFTELPYSIEGQQGILNFADGVQTVTFDTTGLLVAQLQYVNSVYVNRIANSLLLFGQVVDASGEIFLTLPITMCRSTVGVAIPPVPTVTVESLTCVSETQIALVLNFANAQAYLAAVDDILDILHTTTQVSFVGDANVMLNIAVGAASLPIVITHTTPLPAEAFQAGSPPPNLVGVYMNGLGTLADGSVTLTVDITNLPPANAPLFVTVLNPYRLFDMLTQSLASRVVDINNGQTVTAEQVFENLVAFNDVMVNYIQYLPLLLEAVDMGELDCLGTLPDFDLTLSESCDADTGINTLSFTLSGTSLLAQLTPFITVNINGTLYQLDTEDGTQTIAIDTNGLLALAVEYPNPAYIRQILIQQYGGTLPDGVDDLPAQFLTRILSVCDGAGSVTLPEPPSFNVDNVTCATTAGILDITYTNGSFEAYSATLSAVLDQILPLELEFPANFATMLSTFSAIPVIITHTSPLSDITADNIVMASSGGIYTHEGTYTIGIPITMMGGLGGQIPQGASLYLNLLTPRQMGIFLNTVLQPLVDMYNNGETITQEALNNLSGNISNVQTVLFSLFYNQQLDESVGSDCLGMIEVNLQITVTESCDANTGINTISFDISGATALATLTNTNLPLTYVLNGQQGDLLLQDGVQTVTIDTNGLYVLALVYFNPDYINEVFNSMLSGTGGTSDLPMYITHTLSVCGDTTGDFIIPDLPTPTITAVTCPTANQLTFTISFGDTTAYMNAVQALMNAVVGTLGLGGVLNISDIMTTYTGISQSAPMVISHTAPLDPLVLMSSNTMPSNLVGYSLGGAVVDGTTITVTITILLPPPAGTTLYISFWNPYVIVEWIADALIPLLERLRNGEQLTIEEVQEALSSAITIGGDMTALLGMMLTSQQIPDDLLADCLVPYEPFNITISESCDFDTGVNTISITQSGTSLLATFAPNLTVPFIINEAEYFLSLQDGTQTITYDTTGQDVVQMQYLNPDYFNAMIEAMLTQVQPDPQILPFLTRNLTICVGGPEPTPDVTPDVTPEPTPDVTPEPTPDVTPDVTPEPTPDVTPDVTPEPTPDVTPEPTPDVTPDVTPEPTPEVTPVVTIDVPEITPLPPLPTPDATLPPVPTLPPLPTLPPVPTFEVPPSSVCGVVSFGTDGFPVIDRSGLGCEAQDEQPIPDWQPMVMGGAVCLPEVIYHTNQTGNWELFWVGPNRDPQNLSNGGAGTINLAPTRSPDGMWIAFSSNRDGNWEIYIASVITGETIRITYNDTAVDFDPSWSPNGRYIAYESNVAGSWDIWMVDLMTGIKTRLTDHPAPDVNPAWHPDSTHIVFQSARHDDLWQIYELELATGAITRLSDGTADHINGQYSPDGQTVLYKQRTIEMRSLHIMTRDGVHVADVMITSADVDGVWSSDGAYIAIDEILIFGTRVINIYEVATGRTRWLTLDTANAFSPAWICDTTNVVFTSDAQGNNHLYVLDALPMDSSAVDVTVLEPITSGDANHRDPQNFPADENASRGVVLPPR